MGRKGRQSADRGSSRRPRGRRSIRHDSYEEDPAERARANAAGRPPEISLRRLRAEDALNQLAAQVRVHARRGRREVLVVHGRGHGSPGGVPVLKQLVRDWCQRNPDLVKAWRPAPREWGGEGATVILLK